MQKALRDMRQEEIAYFESEHGLWHCFTFLVKQLVAGKEKAINAKNFDLYLDYSNQDFSHCNIEDMLNRELIG